MWCQNIGSMFFHFVTKHACDRHADRQTDRQNHDHQDRASMAASRGKMSNAIQMSTCDGVKYNAFHRMTVHIQSRHVDCGLNDAWLPVIRQTSIRLTMHFAGPHFRQVLPNAK